MNSFVASPPARTDLADPGLVRIDFHRDASTLPVVIEPAAGLLGLSDWAACNRALIDVQFARHGGILFRGFEITEPLLESFIAQTSSGALPYSERSSPRSRIAGNIYTSTDYPAKYPIFLHNEQSYNQTFPLKIYFMCVTPSQTQGSTPLCDSRQVLHRLSPALRRRFAERRYMYVRNFGGGLGLHWRDAFQTGDRREVEAYCRSHRIDAEWRGTDELRTRQVRDVIARHPLTGELSWFNHLTFFHVTTLPAAVREALSMAADEDDFPNNTFYGDGAPIEDAVMDELRGAYESARVSFLWRRNDVLMLDNMLVAHGREPFTGLRRVITGMAAPCAWSDVAVSAAALDAA